MLLRAGTFVSWFLKMMKGGGILLVGATQTKVLQNSVQGNVGNQFNSGGIVVVSAAPFHGSDPAFDTIARNTAYRDQPSDLRCGRHRHEHPLRR